MTEGDYNYVLDTVKFRRLATSYWVASFFGGAGYDCMMKISKLENKKFGLIVRDHFFKEYREEFKFFREAKEEALKYAVKCLEYARENPIINCRCSYEKIEKYND